MASKRWTYPLLLTGALVLLAVGLVLADPTATFDLDWWTVDAGGGTLSSGAYSLDGTAGQPDAGELAGDAYSLSGGFWTTVKYAVYLPVVKNNVCSTYPGPSELEPNNSSAEANGFLCFDTTYTGNPNDNAPNPPPDKTVGEERDWFKFYWDGNGTLNVDVTNFIFDAQVLLYHESNTSVFLDQGFKGDYHLEHNGSAGAGTYYIHVFAPPDHPINTGDYNLTVTVN